MSFTGRTRENYHHGNLKEALVDAALTLIAERGPAGFALNELARAAGVSPAAPYRHFKDRNAIVIEVAKRGFGHFCDAVDAAWNGGKPDPVTAVEAFARAHLTFARENPAYYAAMFETGFSHDEDADLARAADTAFARMRRAADAACTAHPKGRRLPPVMVALHIWALTHGIAALFVPGPTGGRKRLPMAPEDLLEAGLLVYLASLDLRPPPSR